LYFIIVYVYCCRLAYSINVLQTRQTSQTSLFLNLVNLEKNLRKAKMLKIIQM